MIGWWNDLVPIRTLYKKDRTLETLLGYREQLRPLPLIAQMQSKYHAFYWLIRILRHGKDEFVTKQGHLVSLDLDRSLFGVSPELRSINYTWCYTCYMDQWVYDTFQAVGPSQPAQNRLGFLMRDMLALEDIFEGLWDNRLSNSLDHRVEKLLECIDDCIDRYGRQNVLIDHRHHKMTTREIVEWLVRNSDYQNQNGQQGPSNLDFLNEL
jgi:hypothetical protein